MKSNRINQVAGALIYLFCASLPNSGKAEEISNQGLRGKIASGSFAEVLSLTDREIGGEDYETVFLRELARDFIQVRRISVLRTPDQLLGGRLFSGGGSHFVIFEQNTDLGEAAAIAESLGGRLAEVRTREQQEGITSRLLIPVRNKSGSDVQVWTGIINHRPGETTGWHYRSDGREAQFSDWAPGQPDGNENDATVVSMIASKGGKWIDATPTPGVNVPKYPLIEFTSIPGELGNLAEVVTLPATPIQNCSEFDSLRNRAIEAMRNQALDPAEEKFTALLKEYASALGSLEMKAREQGNLEDVVAIRKSIRDLDTLKTLEAFIGQSTSPNSSALLQLQRRFLQMAGEIRKARTERMIPLLETYWEALTSIESQLTREVRIEDAILIRTLRDELVVSLGEGADAIDVLEVAAETPVSTKLQLDTPQGRWPQSSFEPGIPGRIGGFGKVWPGNVELDLTRALGITDFVRVATHDAGWTGLRADGTLVSTDNQLHGKAGVWRMIPRSERGAVYFHGNNTVTKNGESPIEYRGVPMPADQIDWISAPQEGGIVTMKDGSVRCFGRHLTEEEREQIEERFEGVVLHVAYRYGVYGVKKNGEIVIAVLAGPSRMVQENAVRLPEVNQEAIRGVEIVQMTGSRNSPWFLTSKGDLWQPETDWFPQKKVIWSPLGDGYERKFRSDVAKFWSAPIAKVSLSTRGRWYVTRRNEIDGGAFEEELERVLTAKTVPLRDLGVVSVYEKDKDKGASFAIWIE